MRVIPKVSWALPHQFLIKKDASQTYCRLIWCKPLLGWGFSSLFLSGWQNKRSIVKYMCAMAFTSYYSTLTLRRRILICTKGINIYLLYIEHLLYLRDCYYNLTKFKDVYFRTIGKILTLVGFLFCFYFVSSFTLVVFNIHKPLQCNFKNSWEQIHVMYFRRARGSDI